MAVKTHPCADGLTAACFEADPQWAKQAFAFRLMSALVPASISRRLPKWKFSTFMIFPPGWTPGDPLPPGLSIDTSIFFPPGWTPGDPLPPGIIAEPGAEFPPGWKPGDPLPPGFAIDPTVFFPPDWQPGDDLPPEIIWTPALPPIDTGPIAPIYTDPFTPGPKPAPGGPPKEEVEFSITSEVGDGWMYHRSFDWTLLITSPTGTYLGPSAQNRYNIAGWRQWFTDYELNRGFVAFDLSTIPAGAGIVSCIVRIFPYMNDDGNVSILQSAWVDPLALGDWDSSSGSPFDTISWATGAYNDFTLNSAGLNYVKSKFGARAAFCLREYDHDVMMFDPGWPPGSLENGMFFREADNPVYRPVIQIVYTI